MAAVALPRFEHVHESSTLSALAGSVEHVLVITDRQGALWRVSPQAGTMQPFVVGKAAVARKPRKKRK